MKRLLRGAVLICFALATISASAIMIGRRNAPPGDLQQLGFEDCDGDLCFRGLKLGMVWDQTGWKETQRLFVDPWAGDYGITPIQGVSAANVITLKGITVTSGLSRKPLPVTLGALVARLGSPCRVAFNFYTNTSQVESIQLWFSTLTVAIRLARSTDVPLRLDTATDSLLISRHGFLSQEGANRCAEPPDQFIQNWQGFTFVQVYQTRSRRTYPVARP
jgi:hypothetical protein